MRDSTVLCVVLYFLTASSLCGMARLETFSPDTAMAEAFASVGAGWASTVIYFCAFFGIVAAVFTNLLVSLMILAHSFFRVNLSFFKHKQMTDYSLRFSQKSIQGRKSLSRERG